MSATPVPPAAAPRVQFVAEDCELFERYAEKVAWPSGVVSEDRERFKLLRGSLVDLFGWLTSEYGGSTELKAYASRVNPNAFSPPDLWGCAYAAAVGHQSYALQVALIIRRDGAELCFCLGAGWAQINDAAKRAKLTAAFDELRSRLTAVPNDVVDAAAAALSSDYALRKRWRSAPGPSEFDDLRGWLNHAASVDGGGASVSRYLSPVELEGLGTRITAEIASLLSSVRPLIDFVYAVSPSAMDRVEAALSKFEETVDENLLKKHRAAWDLGKAAFDRTFGSESKLDDLRVEHFFGFLNQIDSHTNAESGLFRLGPGTPAPKNPETDSWKALEEDRAKLIDALRTLLFSGGTLAERVDAMLAGPRPRRYITEDLAIPAMLMAFADQANHSGVNRMHRKKEMLTRVGKLPTMPAGAGLGATFVAWDRALRQLPAEYGRDWDWAKTYAFYWSDAFEEFFGSGELAKPDEPDDAALVTLAAELHLSDDQFLVALRELLFQKGQVVLYGPPGTGKTFIASRLMEVLAPDPAQRRVVQFHPSYSYEDFVRGYRPTLDESGGLTYVPEDGPLVTLADQARRDSENLYVLLIDEINRGNLPRIFGELLYLLEYRDQQSQLMYPDRAGSRAFQMPRNLVIVATMNTADRSIGVIDAALRRRFHFVELAPNVPPLDGLLRRWLQANESAMLEVADWVDRLNDKLATDFPGKQIQVGHSYFMPTIPIVGTQKPAPLTEERVDRIWRTDIEPFLQDQLFGQEQKLSGYSLAAIKKAVSAAKQQAQDVELSGNGPSDAPTT